MARRGASRGGRSAGARGRSDAVRWPRRRRWRRSPPGTGTRTCRRTRCRPRRSATGDSTIALPDHTPAARDREMAALSALRARVEAVPVGGAVRGRSRDAVAAAGRDRRGPRLRQLRAGRLGGRRARRHAGGFMRLPELQPVRTPAEGWKLVRADGEDGRVRRPGDRQPAARPGGGEGRHRRRDCGGCWASSTSCWRSPTPSGRCARRPRRRTRLAGARTAGVLARGRRRARRRHPPGLRAPARRCCVRRSCRAPATRRTPASSTSPGAPACYAKLVKVHTSLELPAAEIHRIGLEELARIHAEMARIGKQRSARRAARFAAAAARRSGGVLPRARRRRDGGAQGARARAGGASRVFSGGCRARRASSSASTPSRRRTRRSPITARPPSTARAPPPTTSTPTSPRPARATRSRRSRSTNRCPATTSRSRSRRS